MALVIDDPEVERLAGEIARRRGVSVARAVADALRSAQAGPSAAGVSLPSTKAEKQARIREILARADALPVLDPRPAEVLLDYDDAGMPR